MIVNISRGTYVKGVIKYNENKVAKGEAEIISNNTLEDSLSGKVNAFMENFALNSKVTKNRFAHFSFSLAPGENLSSDDFYMVARDYLTQMGYTDVPELMYRHYDKGHEHIHVVCSSIQYSGKKISEFRDFERGKNICRKLEKSYGLSIVQGESGKHKNLSEINATRYALINGIKKSGFASDKISLEGIETDQDFIRIYGITQYDQLYNDLDRKGHIYKTEKMKLVEKLEYLYSTTSNHQEFLKKTQANGIYARELQEKGQKVLVFGLSGKYFKEKQLPGKFTFENLTKHFGQPVISGKEEKALIKKALKASLKSARDLSELKNLLHFHEIEVKEAKNAGGVYGLSFRLSGNSNPEFFKASDIDRKLSFSGISKQLLSNAELAISKSTTRKKGKLDTFRSQKQVPNQIHTPKGPGLKSPFISTSEDPEELKRKRKKKGLDPDNDQNQGV